MRRLTYIERIQVGRNYFITSTASPLFGRKIVVHRETAKGTSQRWGRKSEFHVSIENDPVCRLVYDQIRNLELMRKIPLEKITERARFVLLDQLPT